MGMYVLTQLGWIETNAQRIPGYLGYGITKAGRVYSEFGIHGKYGRRLHYCRGVVKLHKNGRLEQHSTSELVIRTFGV